MEVDQKRWHITLAEIAVFSMIISTLLLMSSVGRTDSVSEMQQGVEYVRLRLYPQAVDSFKSVLSRNPTDVHALFHLGNVYKLQDELELAIETYKKILSNAVMKHRTVNAQLYGWTHLALAEIYCKQSQLKVAEQHAIEADQTLSNSAETQYRLGYIYTHQAKFDKALVAFNKTLLLIRH